MTILGLGGLLDDAACAVLKNGELKSAVEENKVNRGFRPGTLPEVAMAEALRIAGSAREEIDAIALVRPFSHGPEPEFHLALRDQFPRAEIVVVEHHQAHAAYAYFASPFEDSTVLTLDHSGDFRCGARWRASGNQITVDREWYFPDSLGRLYGAVTELLGFHSGADEHKVQWLSASGSNQFVPLFQEIVSDSARLDESFFDGNRHAAGGFSPKFYERVGLAAGAKIPADMGASIAHAVQKATEDVVLKLAGEGDNLCVAGGLFFNALLVRALETSGRWKNVFVQPAAGNAGTALGGVYHVWHQVRRHMRRTGADSLLLGPSYGPDEVKQVLENCKLDFHFIQSSDEMLAKAVSLLGENKILAWMQGRMEFGPRALGNRSILASPLDPYSTENLNVYIKHREAFRKFAASVPLELASTYFDTGSNARNLATVGRVLPQHLKTFEPALLGSDLIRVHTVSEADNPLYHRLLLEAGKATGLPVLYNTSFNLFGDPLVSTPRDAVRSFYSSGIDAMFVGSFLLEK
jgi:carbamoyltransferase